MYTGLVPGGELGQAVEHQQGRARPQNDNRGTFIHAFRCRWLTYGALGQFYATKQTVGKWLDKSPRNVVWRGLPFSLRDF